MDETELREAFVRYVRGIEAELQPDVNLQPEWASFLRTVEHHYKPDATEDELDDFRRMVAAMYGMMQQRGEYFIPPQLKKPLEDAIRDYT